MSVHAGNIWKISFFIDDKNGGIIFVSLSYLKHTIHLLTYAFMVQIRISEFSHQLVHGSHNVCHLVPRDAAVSVDVVKRKRPT